MKIYLAGSIRGGRKDLERYLKIIAILKDLNCEVLTEINVGNRKVDEYGKGQNISTEEIFKQDINWINEANTVIAEVSTPSLGVGYEISYAINENKRVVCLYQKGLNPNKLSAMVQGNPDVELKFYDLKNLSGVLKEIIYEDKN